MSKFRSHMKPDKCEMLTLGYFLVRDNVKVKVAAKAITDEMLDKEELEDEQRAGEADPAQAGGGEDAVMA